MDFLAGRSGSGDADPPRLLRGAVGLWWALAAFLVVQAGLSWTGYEQLRQQLIERQAPSVPDAASAATSLLWLNTAIAVVLAAGYAVLGRLLLKRRPWVRIALTALVVLHVLMVLGSGAASAPNMIVVLLGGAALVCCWLPASSDWLTGEHD